MDSTSSSHREMVIVWDLELTISSCLLFRFKTIQYAKYYESMLAYVHTSRHGFILANAGRYWISFSWLDFHQGL